MTSAFSWQNSISLCPASFCTTRLNLPITPDISWFPTFAFQSPIMKRTSFGGLVLEGLVAAKSLQSCLTLCDPIDGSPGSAIPGILQARILEWVAISFSNAWKWKVKVKSLSRVWLLATPRTAAYQAPPSMGFSRQEYWSGMPLPSSPVRGRGLNLLCSVECFTKTLASTHMDTSSI